jgi:hypothetical protein
MPALRKPRKPPHIMGLNRPLPNAQIAARKSGWHPGTQLLALVPLTGDRMDVAPEEHARQIVEAMISYAPHLTAAQCEEALLSTAFPAVFRAGSNWPPGKPTLNIAQAFRSVGLGWVVESGLTQKARAERRLTGRVPPIVRHFESHRRNC